MKKIRRSVDDSLEKIIHDHGKYTTGKQEDFIDVMLSLAKSSNQQEEMLNHRDTIKAITLDMLAAGMDTSTTAIEWALSELIRNPEVLKTAQEELKNVVGLRHMVEEHDLPKLEYLNMVVKETLRLHPVAPLLASHESREDVHIGEYYVPKKNQE